MKMKRIFLMTLLVMAVFNLFGQDGKTEKEFKKIKTLIFPVIKVKTTNSTEPSIELKGENTPVFRQIAGDLLCFYGINKGGHYELILQKQLPTNVGLDSLDQISRENLLNEIGSKTKIHKTNFGGIGFSCGGDNEAALLTLPEIWDMVKERIGNNIVFGVPSKDLIVFVNGDKETEIKGLQDLINEVHSSGEKLLSKKLFVYRDGKISEK